MSGSATGSEPQEVDLSHPGGVTVDANPGGTALPSLVPETSAALLARLERLADRARGYVEASSSANTRKAYASDWKHFTA